MVLRILAVYVMLRYRVSYTHAYCAVAQWIIMQSLAKEVSK